jgi:transposase InsO family protein
LWGAPRIHGELLKLGIAVSQATVAKYMSRRRRPPSPTWRTFLANHAAQIVAADFFIVPTVRYRLLFVLVILSLDRRRLAHVAVTAHPTSAWTAQQLREAFPNNEAPRFLLHDRDSAFAAGHATIGSMGICQLRTAPRSPWQNGYVERVIGSIRRECLDHVIVLNEAGLRRILAQYRRTTSTPAPTSDWRRTLRSRGQSPSSDRLSRFRKSAGCIIVTTAASHRQPDGRHHRCRANLALHSVPGHHDDVGAISS